MDKLQTLGGLEVESNVFQPFFKPPGATNALFLGGAGVRGLEIQGKFVKVSTLGVYLEDKAISSLAVKWKGKSAEELKSSVDFYTDVVSGSFEKCIQVTTIILLTGEQFSEKVSQTCVAFWKRHGTYTESDDKVIEKFLEVFKDQKLPPGSSILLTMSPAGSLTISFSKDGIIAAEAGNVVSEKGKLGEAIAEMMLGKHGVSPAAKESLASRLSDLMN